MKKILIILILACMILPVVSADIIFPTATEIYFEKNGEPYNEPVEFTIKCYGYSWSPGPMVEKQPGTYTPETVFSFSASYKRYGEKIYDPYYLNYRHIDYCTLEGETKGEKFVIERYAETPTPNCSHTDQYNIIHGDSSGEHYYKETEEYKTCIKDIENYVPIYGPAKDEPVGATRPDNKGRIWTKQEDGMWTTEYETVGIISCDTEERGGDTFKDEEGNLWTKKSSETHKTYTSFDEDINDPIGSTRIDNEGNIWTKESKNNWYRVVTTTCWTRNETRESALSWGNMVIDEQKGGINYAKRTDIWDECDKYLKEVPESEIDKDEMGNPIGYICILGFDIEKKSYIGDVGPPSEPQTPKKNIFEIIWCFFKRLFGGTC